jgi:hypothetical protein
MSDIEDVWTVIVFGEILKLCEDDFRVFDDDNYYRLLLSGEHSIERGGAIDITLDLKMDDRKQDLLYFTHFEGRERTINATETICGERSHLECIFPFKYEGVSYRTCVSLGQDQKAWCAVDVDVDETCANGCVEYGMTWDFCEPCANEMEESESYGILPVRIVPLSEGGEITAEFQRQVPSHPVRPA